jgi:putative glutamine amidotransferase
MPVRIAIPEPSSGDEDYNRRSLPAYLEALESVGADAVCISLRQRQDEVARSLADVQGILLPGSRYDVDPQTYGEGPIPECDEADPGRAAIDELLLQDAFNLRKPVLVICYGLQALNVWRNGTLIQDLEAQLKHSENHQPGRGIQKAHTVRIAPGSRLAALAAADELPEPWVNSSHHQAIRFPGDNLAVTAVSPTDGVIEAVELASADHFVLGVQWHPERTIATSPLSHAIFAAFVRAARDWEPRRIEESVAAR